MMVANNELQFGRWFDNSDLIAPRNEGNECGGCHQERQRCQLTEQTVVQMNGVERQMSMMWYVVCTLRTTATVWGFLMNM